ncbi:MAG: cytochrome b/b6 domain-containing protein [Anaerolineales bacterium]|nr:cytochrome b/b6 domain-containing protein [Anaerolineales bacterium]
MSQTQASSRYLRFTLAQRIEHLVMMLSFATLALTGLPQKFPLSEISQSIVKILGGIESVRQIHHVAAIVMMFGVIYHILAVGYKLFVLRLRPTMVPTLKDIKDAWQAFLYNLGLAKTYPQMGRYTFEEKMEYWAFVWGAIIMGQTGFMMWNPITTARLLPGEFIPAAKAAHGGEALLAVLAIIIWHMYGVHVRRFNKAMWTGYLSEEEMLHEHPLELADRKAGLDKPQLDPLVLRRRRAIYFPIAAFLAVLMLGGVYFFVFAEETALAAASPVETVPVYAPRTPTPSPTPTLAVSPEAPLTWNGAIGVLFQQKCGLCHGAGSFTGLSLDTYANAMAGGKNGVVILPGKSAESPLILQQEKGGHPGQFSSQELEMLRAWIDAGAPEK